MRKGKLIALYGVNNLGKTTQAKLLISRIQNSGLSQHPQVLYMKYPLYEHLPTGPIINSYLRGGNPYNLDPTSFQLLQSANRLHYDHILRVLIEGGTWVVAEDYRGTGIAWGIGAGVNQLLLEELNNPLVGEDVAILMDGERFMDSIEKGHRHETDSRLINWVRTIHLGLAEKFDWTVINANRSIDEIHEEIWSIVSSKLIQEAAT